MLPVVVAHEHFECDRIQECAVVAAGATQLSTDRDHRKLEAEGLVEHRVRGLLLHVGLVLGHALTVHQHDDLHVWV